MLSDRRQRVLAALIEEYVANALPVGSRTLTERYHLGVSSATVRNELSALEDEGYIRQPHTSAGRVPTDFGYRTFVDDLLSNGIGAAGEDYDQMAEDLRRNASELDSLMEQTTAALARLTDCLSIVMAPSVHDLALKQITLVSLQPTVVLLVLITQDGQVHNRQMVFNMPIGVEDLSAVQRFLNDELVGKSLRDLEVGLGSSIREGYHNPLVRAVLGEIIGCLRASNVDAAHAHSHRLGITSLMAQPEFASSESLVPLMRVLEDDTVLMEVLRGALGDQDEVPAVIIGAENEEAGLGGVSVVASHYGRGDSAGVVAVIGPTRMDYSKVISAVRSAAHALQEE